MCFFLGERERPSTQKARTTTWPRLSSASFKKAAAAQNWPTETRPEAGTHPTTSGRPPETGKRSRVSRTTTTTVRPSGKTDARCGLPRSGTSSWTRTNLMTRPKTWTTTRKRDFCTRRPWRRGAGFASRIQELFNDNFLFFLPIIIMLVNKQQNKLNNFLPMITIVLNLKNYFAFFVLYTK